MVVTIGLQFPELRGGHDTQSLKLRGGHDRPTQFPELRGGHDTQSMKLRGGHLDD